MIIWIGQFYPWLKAIHVIFVIFWMAGLFMLPRFFVYRDIYSHHEDASGPQITGQVTPFGMRIGRKLGGFLELGYGYKGIFNFGCSYRFRTHGRTHTEQ